MDPLDTLHSIPTEVYYEQFLPCFTINEIGNLTMVSKTLKGVFDDNAFWKYLHLRTTSRKILDSSVHIGTYSMRRIKLIDPNVTRDSINLQQFNNINKTSFIDQPPTGSKFVIYPFTYVNGIDIIYKKPICISKNVKTLAQLRIPGTTREFYIYKQPKEVQEIYINYLISEGITNCTCAEHYDPDTLEYNGVKVNYKSFKKMTLKKMLTQHKKDNKPNVLKNKQTKKEAQIKKAREYLETLEKQKEEIIRVKVESELLTNKFETAIKLL